MSSTLSVLPVSIEELKLARDELARCVDSIDRALAAMAKHRIDPLNMYYKKSMYAADGGLKRVITFADGLDESILRVNAGLPISENETRDETKQYARRLVSGQRLRPLGGTNAVAQKKPATAKKPVNQAVATAKSGDAVTQDLQELMRAIVREELSKAVAAEHSAQSRRKPKSR